MSAKSRRTIQTRGAAIRVSESGWGAPACIFLHYWGGSGRIWDEVIDRIDGRARCVAVDQRGWGESVATDDRYDLVAMADDVEGIVEGLALERYVLVGHSMGGKVAQIVAARRPASLVGLLLVAPAPPTPMPVAEKQRGEMLASYGSREGVEQALMVLAGSPLSEAAREQVIEDTLRGAPGAKREWAEHGMIEDVSGGLRAVSIPTVVAVGDRDRVEHDSALRQAFSRFLPHATFQLLSGVGHLSPLERPGELGAACLGLLATLSSSDRELGDYIQKVPGNVA
jgi:pimeloyl-ACP methyl ester carboxylesterase